jgi:hypothetical protein
VLRRCRGCILRLGSCARFNGMLAVGKIEVLQRRTTALIILFLSAGQGDYKDVRNYERS